MAKRKQVTGAGTADLDRDLETVMELVDELGDPARMNKREWVAFLEQIQSDCASRAEAAREEMANEG